MRCISLIAGHHEWVGLGEGGGRGGLSHYKNYTNESPGDEERRRRRRRRRRGFICN